MEAVPPRLSPRESAALGALMERPNRAMRKDALLLRVFPTGSYKVDALDVVICRLRKKLVGGAIEIVTLRGLGYVARIDNGEVFDNDAVAELLDGPDTPNAAAVAEEAVTRS